MDGHQVEPAAEVFVVRATLEREKVRDQLVELAVGDVNVRIAQQRHEIVCVRSHPRILEVDDVEAAVVQHQVAAVIVAMAQHTRLGGELLHDRRPFGIKRVALGCAERRRAIAFDEMLREEIQLPCQLVDVERNRVRDVAIGLQLGAAPLQLLDQ